MPDNIADTVRRFVDDLAAGGKVFRRSQNGQRLVAPAGLNRAALAFVREHRAAILALLPLAVPTVVTDDKPADSEPVLYANGRRITEHDVREAMQALGDDTLADYLSGRLLKAEAYEMTRLGLRQLGSMRHLRRLP